MLQEFLTCGHPEHYTRESQASLCSSYQRAMDADLSADADRSKLTSSSWFLR